MNRAGDHATTSYCCFAHPFGPLIERLMPIITFDGRPKTKSNDRAINHGRGLSNGCVQVANVGLLGGLLWSHGELQDGG